MKLDTWLDKTYKLRAETAVGPKVMWGDNKKHGINEIYFNKWLGTPKYDNGLDILFKRGYSPIDALVEWLRYTPWKKKWGRKLIKKRKKK